MDKYINIAINTSIYIIYLIIGLVSISITYKVSMTMCLIVIVIEYSRLIAIYRRVYWVVLLLFVINLSLVGYNSYKEQLLIDGNNQLVIQKNERTLAYTDIKKDILKADTFKNFTNDIEKLEKVSVDYWMIIGLYIFLELALIGLIRDISKKEKQTAKPKPVKSAKYTGTKSNKNSSHIKEDKEKEAVEINQDKAIYSEKGEFIGSARDYAKDKGLSVREAEKELKELRNQRLLIKKDGKNYLIREGN